MHKKNRELNILQSDLGKRKRHGNRDSLWEHAYCAESKDELLPKENERFPLSVNERSIKDT